MNNKILIVGDSGRGKTTLALMLSNKTGIPHYSTDDFYWKVKFSEPNPRDLSIIEINKIYDTDHWIVEGSSRHLIQHGLDTADIIYFLEFKNIIHQFYVIIRRAMGRKHETWYQTWKILKHIALKNMLKIMQITCLQLVKWLSHICIK